MTTQQWLDKMVRRFGTQTKLARFLKVTPADVSHWKHGRNEPRDRTLAKSGYGWQIVKR